MVGGVYVCMCMHRVYMYDCRGVYMSVLCALISVLYVYSMCMHGVCARGLVCVHDYCMCAHRLLCVAVVCVHTWVGACVYCCAVCAWM